MAYTTINKSSDYFNTVLYTGNGSTQSITGVGFQPDWVWVKDRTNSYEHAIFDAVRGVTKRLSSNATTAETTEANGLTAFGTDGFSVGSTSNVNYNGYNFASWNWKANGQGSSNTDGSISSTVSANTTAGFSIVKWTGTGSASTVGHGLGVAPKCVIMKNLDDASGHWWVYHNSIGAGQRLLLNLTNASGANTDFVNNTAPTTSVFSVKNESNNTSGNDIIAYCFADKTGFSKFGSYTGNGNADGSFIYTGFKPAMVIIKLYSTGAENWRIFDNKRIGYNPNNYKLYPSLNSAEGTSDLIDIYSNGFKPRTTSIESNGSGNGYIYMAFAEAPLVGSNNVPCTAR